MRAYRCRRARFLTVVAAVCGISLAWGHPGLPLTHVPATTYAANTTLTAGSSAAREGRLPQARPGGTTAYSYDALDRLTQAGSTSYGYDADGNETSAGAATLGYDLANRLTSYASGGATTTYGYDGDGNRLQASTGSLAADKTNFLWDVNLGLPQLALERDGNDSLLRRYVYGAERISLSSGGAAFYYHYDPLGSVRNVTDAAGATQWTTSYEPYGAVRAASHAAGAPVNPFGFTGEYGDPSGLWHLGARDYDPATGRFLRPDPAAETTDQPHVGGYVYVAGRPTAMVDPSGLTLEPPGTGASMAALAASAARACRFDGGDIGAWLAACGRATDAVMALFWAQVRASFDRVKQLAADLSGLTDARTCLAGGGTACAWAALTIVPGGRALRDLKLGEDLLKTSRAAAEEEGALGRAIHSRYPDSTPVYEGEQPARIAGPDPAAQGPHSVLRWDRVNARVYQGREYDAAGHPVVDIDFTHPTFPNGTLRPGHTAPEWHPWEVNDPRVGPSSGFRRGPGMPTRPGG